MLSYAGRFFNSAVTDIIFILPPASLALASLYGRGEYIRKAFLIESRCLILDFSYNEVFTVSLLLAAIDLCFL